MFKNLIDIIDLLQYQKFRVKNLGMTPAPNLIKKNNFKEKA